MQNNKTNVSIIIPVYNSEKYLFRLFDCLKKQTYSFFEVIIIDDGSYDKTSSISKQQCFCDARFKYFYKENGGASSARNLGLKKAIYDLILFIDSDDLISEDYVDSFVKTYESTKADIISFKIQIPSKKEKDCFFESVLNTKTDIINAFFNEQFGVGPTSKLFLKSNLNNLAFNEKLIFNEDKLFLFEYLTRCTSAFVSSTAKYYVKSRPDSISHSVAFDKKTSDLLYVHKTINKFIETSQCFFSQFKQHNLKNLLFIFKMYCRSCDFTIKKNDPLFIEIKNLINSGKKTKGRLKIKTKIEVFLFNYFINLYTRVLQKYYNHN